ncbi:AMP-binding protein [Vibrio hangzhouensis]|uniref:AMP-binding protein n=1 Tax=Vibrio hangzhouensis TaxID=462991 RepID=UPI001C982317|nr:AMP-binding protein [Vibrio hangzhouensis]MBY6195656.1 AMP-binding protein [Vibrio hangzhouensis]
MSDNNHNTTTQTTAEVTQTVLDTVRTLMLELDPDALSSVNLTLKSDLDSELGFDSLTRAELLTRIETHFHVSLPEHSLSGIATPEDIVQAIQQAVSTPLVEPVITPLQQIKLDTVDQMPDDVESLQALLDWHVEHHPDRPHLYVFQNANDVEEISYQKLKDKAMEIAAGLINAGVEAGDCVAIMLPTSNDYFFSFFGILYARAIPVPIYPPARLQQIEDHLGRHASILNNAEAKLLITVPEAKPLAHLLKLQVPSIEAVVTAADLQGSTESVEVGDAQSDDIAFLQYTSGSTGVPKGVTLTHSNLLANVRAMGKAVGASSNDVFVSWLPVYHDMGLIGAWLGSLYHTMPLVIMSPLLFLTKPQRWLWAIHHYKGTLSPAPNFAYELCVSRVKESELEGLNLSSWRLSWNGAEPVSPQSIANFTEKYAPYGFKPETMSPVYGLAESSVGLTFPLEVRKPRIEYFDRESLSRNGRAVAVTQETVGAIPVVGLGQPLVGHQIRIVDELGKELPEGEEGELEFKGPSATQGYYRNPEKTRELYHDDWLVTGDRAFTLSGELFLTGRTKDIIIKAGRNIYPHELEQAVGGIDGVRKGCVAVFGSQDRRSGTEKLIVLAESRETDPRTIRSFKKQINNLAVRLLGSPADDIVIGPPHTIPKTSSGKIRRSACKELYQEGKLGRQPKAFWHQAMHLAVAGVVPQLRRYARTLQDVGYAAYAWLILGALSPMVWILVALLPKKSWCWAVTRMGARALITLTGTKCTVTGLENLPDEHQSRILVVNHCSYLDGLVLIATTGLECRFVAKSEFLRNPFTRIFLSKLGTEFVERFDVEKSVVDAKRLMADVDERQPLVVFPEGTLYRMAGLHQFHMGAFIAAVSSDVPVIPITLCGTRSKLRGNSLFPRRGDVSVTIGKPLYPEGDGWSAAISLRDKARTDILSHCGEPDMAHNSVR